MTLDDFARALVAGARAFVVVAEDALGPPRTAITIEPDRLLLKRELAERLGRSTATIDRYVAAGMPCEPFGSEKRFKYEDCEAWIKARPVRRALPVSTEVRCLSRGAPNGTSAKR